MSALCWDGWLPFPHSRLSLAPPKRHLSCWKCSNLVLCVPCTFPSQLPVVSGFDKELSKSVWGMDNRLAFSSGGGGSLVTFSGGRPWNLVLGDVVVGPNSGARLGDAHPGATWKFRVKGSGHKGWTCGLVPVANQRYGHICGDLFHSERYAMALGGTYAHAPGCVTPKDSTVTVTVTVTHTPKPQVWVAFDDESVLFTVVPERMFPLRLAIMGWGSGWGSGMIIELVT